MNILITGAAGFIGFHVAQRLLSEGHKVYGVDSLPDNKEQELKLMRLRLLGIGREALTATATPAIKGNFRFLRLDLRDRESVISLCMMEKFEHIIHLAAEAGAGRSLREPASFFDNNVLATENVLEAARQGGAEHLFFASSSVVHGARSHAPQSEEDDIDSPLSMYAGSKRAAEILCYTYSQAYKLPVTVFRFFTAYGPWGRPDSVPMMLARDITEGRSIRVLNDGYLVRDFTYVDDIVDGISAALASPPLSNFGSAPYALYNIGRSKPVTLLSFIQALETSLGLAAHIEYSSETPFSIGECVEIYADTSKLERQLAYSPVWDYEEATPHFITWFREHYGVSFTM